MTTKFFKRNYIVSKKLNDGKNSLRGYASPKLITQNDFVHTENQEDQTPQVDQRNLVHAGQPKKSVNGETFLKPPGRDKKSSHNSCNHEKQKQTQTFIKSNIELNRSKGKNGGPQKQEGHPNNSCS